MNDIITESKNIKNFIQKITGEIIDPQDARLHAPVQGHGNGCSLRG